MVVGRLVWGGIGARDKTRKAKGTYLGAFGVTGGGGGKILTLGTVGHAMIGVVGCAVG